MWGALSRTWSYESTREWKQEPGRTRTSRGPRDVFHGHRELLESEKPQSGRGRHTGNGEIRSLPRGGVTPPVSPSCDSRSRRLRPELQSCPTRVRETPLSRSLHRPFRVGPPPRSGGARDHGDGFVRPYETRIGRSVPSRPHPPTPRLGRSISGPFSN